MIGSVKRRWRVALLLGIASVASAGEVQLTVPPDVLPPMIPADNPVTSEKVALGQKLYFDPRLSKDDSVSCATCHDPLHAFAEPRPVSLGVGGAKGARNAPTVLNAAFLQEQFWDGRAATLEEQAKGPLVNPVEMAMADHAAVEKKSRRFPSMRRCSRAHSATTRCRSIAWCRPSRASSAP
jgi:cytochrome c peroxidase